VLLGQPTIWTVPLAFAVMIVASLLTQRTLPRHVEQAMLRMHLPEALSRKAHSVVGPSCAFDPGPGFTRR
jgi:hypothetical protein